MSAKKRKADADETETAENRIACRKEDGENNIIKDENIYILNHIQYYSVANDKHNFSKLTRFYIFCVASTKELNCQGQGGAYPLFPRWLGAGAFAVCGQTDLLS